MGASATGSASRTRESTDNWQNSSGSKDATFNSPEGQDVLKALTGFSTGQKSDSNPYVGDAASIFKQQAGAGVNPYTENVIAGNNQEADKLYSQRMATLRAGGYRGGTASNEAGQARFTGDFTNQQAAGNANLRQNAYDTQASRALQAGSGLAGLGGLSAQTATQLLALLRGESSAGSTAGGTSGTKSTTAQSLSAAFNV